MKTKGKMFKSDPMFPHQAKTFKFAMGNPYSILALDPRLGKTRIAIEVRERLRAKCLVICPSHLILNWEREINKWAKKAPKITIFTSGKTITEVKGPGYVVISYNLVQKAPHLFEWADMVVLDEAHYIKSMEAKRTAFIHQHIYENSTPRVHLLTGSPLVNRVKEFYSLLALTNYNPNIPETKFLTLYPSEIDFADRFSHRHEYTMEIRNRFVTILKWDGLKNSEELKTWLKGKYIRIRAKDVLGMPEIFYKSVLISKTPDVELLKSFEAFFEGEGAGSVKPDAKAEAALRKVPFTIKYAKDLLEEVPCVLIYSDHVKAAEAIAAEFKVPALTGKMDGNMRSILADEFQNGKGQVLVATIGALKEGKDLFRASNLILNDYPWVPGNLKQVVNRMVNVKKNTLCTVHQIIGSPQDEYISEVIREKALTIDRAT